MSKKPYIYKLLLGFITLLYVGCPLNSMGLKGSGSLRKEVRDVSQFNQIHLSGIGSVEIIQGEKESLEIETDDNVMDLIRAEVRNGTLYLDHDRTLAQTINPTKLIFSVYLKNIIGVTNFGSGSINAEKIVSEELEITIKGSGNVVFDSLKTKNFDIEINGSGDGDIADFDGEELDISIKGSGNAELAGKVKSQEITINGSGDYRGGKLRSDSADISIKGSGSAKIWVVNTLNVDIDGSGSAHYFGNPLVNSNISGSGDIKSLGEKN